MKKPKLTTQKIKQFLGNLANALVPGSTLGFAVHATATRNQYSLACYSKKNDADKYFVLNYLCRYDRWMMTKTISSKISKLVQASFEIPILLKDQFISFEKFISLFKINEDDLYQMIFNAICQEFSKIIKVNSYNPGESIGVSIVLDEALDSTFYSLISHSVESVKDLTSVDELIVWADLHGCLRNTPYVEGD